MNIFRLFSLTGISKRAGNLSSQTGTEAVLDNNFCNKTTPDYATIDAAGDSDSALCMSVNCSVADAQKRYPLLFFKVKDIRSDQVCTYVTYCR